GVMVDDRLIARVEASDHRSDVVARLDIAGNCGFRFVPTIPSVLRHDGAIVSLIDLASGLPIPVSRPLEVTTPFKSNDPVGLEVRLQDLLRQVVEMTDRLAGFHGP